MNAEQRHAVRMAANAHRRRDYEDANAARWVATSLKLGVPILTLANALGVSRSRIRVLARSEQP